MGVGPRSLAQRSMHVGGRQGLGVALGSMRAAQPVAFLGAPRACSRSVTGLQCRAYAGAHIHAVRLALRASEHIKCQARACAHLRIRRHQHTPTPVGIPSCKTWTHRHTTAPVLPAACASPAPMPTCLHPPAHARLPLPPSLPSLHSPFCPQTLPHPQ